MTGDQTDLHEIIPDLSQGLSFRFQSLSGDTLLRYPHNIVPGTQGEFVFTQDTIGDHRLHIDGRYRFVGEFDINRRAGQYTIVHYAIDLEGNVCLRPLLTKW